jgi:hypothetical protein
MSARLIALSIVLALAACGEKAQTAGQASTKKSDAKAWEGATNGAYTDSGWKAGDKDSWEAQMKTRAQQGQNEYTRVAATPSSARP